MKVTKSTLTWSIVKSFNNIVLKNGKERVLDCKSNFYTNPKATFSSDKILKSSYLYLII